MSTFVQLNNRNLLFEFKNFPDNPEVSPIPKKNLALTLFSVVTIGLTPIQQNFSEPTLKFSDDRPTKSSHKSIGFYSNGDYAIINVKNEDASKEATNMNEVTHKDLLEQERQIISSVDKKTDDLLAKIDTNNSKINEVYQKISKLESSINGIENQIIELPNKLKASRWDTFLTIFAGPIIGGIVVAVAIYIFGLNK